jgi:hypothetical protein
MLVAVLIPVARRNSASTSRPEWPSSAAVAVRESLADAVQNAAVHTDALTHDERLRVFQSLLDARTGRYLAHPAVPGIVREDDDDAREMRPVRSAEIQQHAVVSGDRNDLHADNPGSCPHKTRRGAGYRRCIHVLNLYAEAVAAGDPSSSKVSLAIGPTTTR